MPKPLNPKINWEAIRALSVAGVLTHKQISEITGVPKGTIAARSAREGWLKDLPPTAQARLAKNQADQEDKGIEVPGNPESGVEGALEPVSGGSRLQESAPTTQTPLVEGVAAVLKDQKGRFKRGMARGLARAAESMEQMDGQEILARGDKVASLARAGEAVFGPDEERTNLIVSIGFLKDESPLAREAKAAHAREIEADVTVRRVLPEGEG